MDSSEINIGNFINFVRNYLFGTLGHGFGYFVGAGQFRGVSTNSSQIRGIHDNSIICYFGSNYYFNDKTMGANQQKLSVYQQAMGHDFYKMPVVFRKIHSGQYPIAAEGQM